MTRRSTGNYPPGWPEFARQVKTDAGWCCVRCHHPNDRASGHVLTVHHLTMNRAEPFEHWWAFAALCQRCHLQVQHKVDLARPWVMQPHSEWFREYAAGWYAWHYLGLTLTREEVRDRLEELLSLEFRAVIGGVA